MYAHREFQDLPPGYSAFCPPITLAMACTIGVIFAADGGQIVVIFCAFFAGSALPGLSG